MPDLVTVSSVVLDLNVYPREKVNDAHVSHLVEVTKHGAVLPPIIVARKVGRRNDGRVVDGFHRVTAKLREGEDAVIAVEWRDYPNEAALFEDAVRLNAVHGYQLNATDLVRIVHLGRGLGCSTEGLARVLHTSVEELERRGRSIAVVASPGKRTKGATTLVPLKRTFRNLQGKTLTPEQERANSMATGHPQSFLVDQVLRILTSGAADLDSPLVVGRLIELRDVLNGLDLERAA